MKTLSKPRTGRRRDSSGAETKCPAVVCTLAQHIAAINRLNQHAFVYGVVYLLDDADVAELEQLEGTP